MKTELLLWASLITSPIVWFINLEASFAWAPLACQGRGKSALYLMTLLALALSIASGFLACIQWSHVDREETRGSRRSFMAMAGMATSFLFVLVIVAQAIPTFLFSGCE